MKDEPPSSHQRPSWFERISQSFSREPQDKDQLIQILREARSREVVSSDDLAMLEGVVQLGKMQARDIMIPRSQMIVIKEDDTLPIILPTIIESAHSRFPVIGDNRDEIIGILLAKDLLQFSSPHTTPNFHIKEMLRPVVFVPESKRLNVLLKEFRVNRNHMAIVVDEYGGVAGLVTIEDILEQIVGEIEDEYDVDEDTFIKPQYANTFSINPLTPIEDFNDYFNSNLSDDEADTIGGIVMKSFGYLPKPGEEITIGGYHFKVINANNRRIRLLQASMEDSTHSVTE